jgi:hypothetical protein
MNRYDSQNYWKSQRRLLQQGELSRTLLIVQDFSALETTEKCQNHQDLIITVYKHNPECLDNLEIPTLCYLFILFYLMKIGNLRTLCGRTQNF